MTERPAIPDTAEMSRERLRDVHLWRGLQIQKGLSDREIQVVILLVLGCSLGQIAERLGIRRNTVVTYVRRIKGKCGQTNRAKLVVDLLMASGLLLQ